MVLPRTHAYMHSVVSGVVGENRATGEGRCSGEERGLFELIMFVSFPTVEFANLSHLLLLLPEPIDRQKAHMPPSLVDKCLPAAMRCLVPSGGPALTTYTTDLLL